MLINLYSGENSILRELKEWKILLSLLLASTIDPLTSNHYLEVRFLSNS